MSHFSVLVVTDSKPTDTELAAILQPWHEYECTGIEDEYVIDVDCTEEALGEYGSRMASRLRAPDGSLHCPYDDKFYRTPTNEERKKIGPIAGTGWGDGMSWTSKDWGDGRGYSTKVRFVPDGWEKIDVPLCEVEKFSQWASGWYGGPVIREGSQDVIGGDATKYGYVLIKNDGAVQVIDRTNPNKKWDWWVVGGRYSGKFDGADQAPINALHMADLKVAAVRGREDWIADALIKSGLSRDELDRACRAHHIEHAEWLALPASDRPRGSDYHDWLAAKGGDFELLSRAVRSVWEMPDPAEGQSLDEWSAAASPITCFAFVHDGKWHERGEMGWWACVSNEKGAGDWQPAVDAMLASLRPDQWITCVDCHI